MSQELGGQDWLFPTLLEFRRRWPAYCCRRPTVAGGWPAPFLAVVPTVVSIKAKDAGIVRNLIGTAGMRRRRKEGQMRWRPVGPLVAATGHGEVRDLWIYLLETEAGWRSGRKRLRSARARRETRRREGVAQGFERFSETGSASQSFYGARRRRLVVGDGRSSNHRRRAEEEGGRDGGTGASRGESRPLAAAAQHGGSTGLRVAAGDDKK